MRWDGTSWTTVATPAQQINDVWGSSVSDVWAVGINGTLLHFDGTSWTNVSAPSAGHVVSVSGTGPNDVWFAGSSFIWHWDGIAVTPSLSPPAAMTSVLAVSATEAYGFGNKTVQRWNGSTWTEVFKPRSSATAAVKRGAEIWAVGNDGEILVRDASGQWRTNLQMSIRASEIYAAAADDVFSVNWFGEAMRWRPDAGWKALPPLTGVYDGGSGSFPIQALWGSSATDVWAGGGNDNMYRWDGTAWTRLATGTLNTWTDLHGTSPSNVWATGIDTAARWDGSAWAVMQRNVLNETPHPAPRQVHVRREGGSRVPQ